MCLGTLTCIRQNLDVVNAGPYKTVNPTASLIQDLQGNGSQITVNNLCCTGRGSSRAKPISWLLQFNYLFYTKHCRLFCTMRFYPEFLIHRKKRNCGNIDWDSRAVFQMKCTGVQLALSCQPWKALCWGHCSLSKTCQGFHCELFLFGLQLACQ